MSDNINGVPTANEMNRRLQRMEDRMEMRIISSEVYAADKATHEIARAGLEHRIVALEATQGMAVKMLIAALFGLLGQAVFIVMQVVNGGGKP